MQLEEGSLAVNRTSDYSRALHSPNVFATFLGKKAETWTLDAKSSINREAWKRLINEIISAPVGSIDVASNIRRSRTANNEVRDSLPVHLAESEIFRRLSKDSPILPHGRHD